MSALALGWLGSPVWAQTNEPPSGLPQPTPVAVTVETATGPTPTKVDAKTDTKAAGEAIPTAPRVMAESSTCCPSHGFLGHRLFGPCGHFHGLFNHVGHGCGTWSAGAGIYLIAPNFETNPAVRISTATGVATTTTQRDFTWGSEVAPLAWLAYTREDGWGVRGRWYNFDGDSNVSAVHDGSAGLTLIFPDPLGVIGTPTVTTESTFDIQSNLRLDVWDLEATKSLQSGPWTLLVAAGVRYAHMSQDYNFVGVETATGDTATLRSGHNFNGIGPSFALESRRALGGNGLALYGNARGAVLFGTAKQTAFFALADAAGVVTASALNTAQQSDVLPVGELEVGLEYGRQMGHVRVFAQAGFVGQVWWGAGNASNTAIFGSSDNSSNLGFVGGAFRLGFSF
jgi:hypothetical protein